MPEGSASIVINRSAQDVFDAVTDVSRMGEWSPECIGGRWVSPATGPATGASFEGDNIVKAGPVTLKKWTTTSEVTECIPGEVFEFSAAGFTTWRYEFAGKGDRTTVTESFHHDGYEGLQKFVYGTLFQRDKAMVKGMQATLTRIKDALEKAN